MATHFSTLAWKIPWMEEPGRLQSMGSRRVRHDWATSISLSCIWQGNGNPLPCSCLENPRVGGAWWAAVYGVAQSRTRLKLLSSSSSSCFNVFLLVKLYDALIISIYRFLYMFIKFALKRLMLKIFIGAVLGGRLHEKEKHVYVLEQHTY